MSKCGSKCATKQFRSFDIPIDLAKQKKNKKKKTFSSFYVKIKKKRTLLNVNLELHSKRLSLHWLQVLHLRDDADVQRPRQGKWPILDIQLTHTLGMQSNRLAMTQLMIRFQPLPNAKKKNYSEMSSI